MRSSFVLKLGYMGLALILFGIMLPLRAHIQDIRTNPKYRLSEANLGDVDPTSSTMVLVLGGMRGAAADVLWIQALDMQKEHDWTNLEPVVESIVKLQPHFIYVWTFQGWNLSYNISVEWDAVEDKYYWIKRGIKFLRRGTEENEHSPELRWDVGWHYFHKIGKSDEATVLRKLFRQDDQPEIGADGRRQLAFNRDERWFQIDHPAPFDNYEVSREWFQSSVRKLDELRLDDPRARPRRMGEVAFRSYPAHAQTNYAIAREEDGFFAEQIQRDFLDAVELWKVYADFEYPFTDSKSVKLDYSAEVFAPLRDSNTVFNFAQQLAQEAAKDWEKQTTEERAKLQEDWTALIGKTDRLLEDFGQPVQEALRIDRSDEKVKAVLAAIRSALHKLRGMDAKLVTDPGPAGQSARKQLDELVAALVKLGGEHGLASEEIYWVDRYASMINYRYWKERSICEAEIETITARRHFYDGEQMFDAGDPAAANTEFEKGLEIWQRVLPKYPHMSADDITMEDTVKIVQNYFKVREQLDLPPLPPEKVPFQAWVERATAPGPSPEEMDLMRQFQVESQKPGADMEKIKASMMEKMEKLKKERAKTGGPAAPPAKEPVPTRPSPKVGVE